VITVLEPDGTIRYESPAVTRVLGYRPDELVGLGMTELVHPDDVAALAGAFARGLADPAASAVIPPQRYRCRHKSGSWVVLEGTGAVRTDDPDVRGIVGSARDVTDRVRAETEREELIAKLQSALADVKTLSGLLPICASCKRIRDDSGYWQQIEQYVRDHTDASFSHGICPTCADRLYAGFLDDADRKG